MESITINFDYESAELLVSALEAILKYDEKNNFLLTEEFNVLGDLKNVLLTKVGE